MFWPSKAKQVSCSNCEHYAELRRSDKLNPDKTITKGGLVMMQCRKGDFELKDLQPCELFKKRPYGQPARLAIPIPKPTPTK